MTIKKYQNETIRETIYPPDLLSGMTVGTWQEDYPLREIEFHHIKNGKSITLSWANNVLLASIGFSLNLVAKGYSDITKILLGEWIAIFVGIAVAVVMYIIGYFFPNERKKAIKKIDEHFNTSPTRRSALKGEDYEEK